MKKIFYSITALVFLFYTSHSYGKDSADLIEKDIKVYSEIEKELNEKMKIMNDRMVNVIKNAKINKDFISYEKECQDIVTEFSKLLKIANNMTSYLATKTMKKYHRYSIKIIENQIKLAKEQMCQFKNKGEFGGNDAKRTQLKYNSKIRKLKRQQKDEMIEIVEKLNKK